MGKAMDQFTENATPLGLYDPCLLYTSPLQAAVLGHRGTAAPGIQQADRQAGGHQHVLRRVQGAGKAPVSYTHLDVYKRQHSGRPAYWWPGP